jgi:hypothetical protein
MLLTFLIFSFAGVIGMLSYKRHDKVRQARFG